MNHKEIVPAGAWRIKTIILHGGSKGIRKLPAGTSERGSEDLFKQSRFGDEQ